MALANLGNGVLSTNVIPQQRSFTIELVGPAGVGKTTLLHALCQQAPSISSDIRLNKLKQIPFFIGNTLNWLPSFYRQYPRTRWFNWGEMRSMLYLDAWQQLITSGTSSKNPITVMDHGPIFRLALLYEFGPSLTKSRRFERWWSHRLESWSDLLRIVVTLDADDRVLLKRIRTRRKKHTVKEKSEHEIVDFLNRYRSAYRYIIDKMTDAGGPIVLYFDTSERSSHQIAGEVLAAVESINDDQRARMH